MCIRDRSGPDHGVPRVKPGVGVNPGVVVVVAMGFGLMIMVLAAWDKSAPFRARRVQQGPLCGGAALPLSLIHLLMCIRDRR